MCGIAGIIATEGGAPSSDALRRMAAAMRHRGPDADGFWQEGPAALAHRRLSIIDLSEAGRQPLSNEDGSVWITFNGEIYNFQQLREELEGLGHRFRTRTDTEAIVHAYEQWGTECARRLRGMFAFAIWDSRQRRLFLARDRLGKKPLFFTEVKGTFRFASELQGLLADPAVPREVDLPAIDAYLALGYVPGPRTAFRGIDRLPPAHWMTVDATPEGAVIHQERYWTLDYQPKLRLGVQEAAEALREKLTEAVRLRMISDVPLGAFLSGGIDSSVVVGLMAQLSERPVKTFSIGFEEAAYNELDHARRIARRWRTDHNEFVVKPDAVAILPLLARHYGEPYADFSAVPTYYVSQLTRTGVTVALSGDGGDETFAGYTRYRTHRLAHRAGALARPVWPLLKHVLPRIPGAGRRAYRFLAAAREPAAASYGRWVGHFSAAARAEICTPDFRAASADPELSGWLTELYARAEHLDPVDAAMAVDVQSYLPYDILAKVDISSMANSLEARAPLLDHEVVELAARLPVPMKLRGRQSKALLKRAFADLLPAENVQRKKMGFRVPVDEWFRGPLRPLLQDTLLSRRALERGYFRPDAVRGWIRDLDAGENHRGCSLWNLLMLELWHQEMVDRVPSPCAD